MIVRQWAVQYFVVKTNTFALVTGVVCVQHLISVYQGLRIVQELVL